MAEYIEREAVVRAFCERCRDYVDKCTYDGACEVSIIAGIPTADVQPVRHGRWIVSSDGYYPYCSECKERPEGKTTKYCPNCGAMMVMSYIMNTNSSSVRSAGRG